MPSIASSQPEQKRRTLSGSEGGRKTLDISGHAKTRYACAANNSFPHQHNNNHYRNYQRRSSPNSTASGSSSKSPLSIKSDTKVTPSERYVNSNFRFLAHQGASNAQSTASSLWDSVECVIIPISEDPACPICLEAPCAPRVTQCGHFFCFSCLLRYLLITTPDSPGVSKNWRSCPVCADQFHRKKIKPVHFYRVLGAALGKEHEFALLKRISSDTVQCLQRDLLHVKPSPFVKVTKVSLHEIEESILMPERKGILDRMKSMSDSEYDDSSEQHFLEQALEIIAEQLSLLHDASAPIEIKASKDDAAQEIVYFHQSVDGQYLFLDSLTIKMLKSHYGSYDLFPVSLRAPIKGLDNHVMGRDASRRFRYLSGHVPAGATFTMCELDLHGVVSDAVLAQFGREISIRQDARDERFQREEFESKSAARKNSLDDGYMLLDGDPITLSSSYKDDIVNFPPPPGTDPAVPVRPAIWYTQSPLIEEGSPSNSLLFNLSLEDLSSSPPADASASANSSSSSKKKGKSRYVLIGGTQQRR